MAAKKPAYTRAYDSKDNLWDTVDTIMVDLLHQGRDGGGVTDTDVDTEKNNITTKKKERELDEMMENLDTLLDDLRDISSISNDNPTPPRSINSSAEKIKPKRPTNDHFLEKENPLDSITQGLLYQTGDVPLFASSEVPRPGASDVVEEDYNEESEDIILDWVEEASLNQEASQVSEQKEFSSRVGSPEIEELQLVAEEELQSLEKSDSQGNCTILYITFTPPLTFPPNPLHLTSKSYLSPICTHST